MPKLSFRDCKYKRKNSFRQNFPGKIPDSAAKGMLRAIRPSNAATHGGRAAAKTDTVTASGPAIFRPEMPRPGPAPKFAPKRPNNPVPGRRNHSADRPGAPASLPGSFRATSGQRAPSPDNRPERPSPPVPNDGFSECHRTGTPRPSARPDQTPGKRGRPPRRSGFHPETVPDKILRKTQISRPGRKARSEPAPHPPRMPLEKQTPPAAGPEVSRIYPGIGLPPKPGPDQRTLNPSSARTGMGRLA